jgi:hypothetical protein
MAFAYRATCYLVLCIFCAPAYKIQYVPSSREVLKRGWRDTPYYTNLFRGQGDTSSYSNLFRGQGDTSSYSNLFRGQGDTSSYSNLFRGQGDTPSYSNLFSARLLFFSTKYIRCMQILQE